MQRRALYNSLRQNWVLDPTLEVESWQVEDYRSLPLDTIFERLEDKQIHLDKTSFLAFAESVDAPEDLADGFTADLNFDAHSEDQIYLLVFELWRRLLPEKPCLSIFCDELDHQIHLYDRGQADSPEAIQDVLANLQLILDENTDEGADPLEVFEGVNSGCANDLETFLYDFIAEQIDNQNFAYAAELLDGFSEYIHDQKWFDFLRSRVQAYKDPEGAQQLVSTLVKKAEKDQDLEFNLELMSSLIAMGDERTFKRLLNKSINLIQVEEDFQDLLAICADFYRCLDKEAIEQEIQNLLQKRAVIPLKKDFSVKDTHVSDLMKLLG